MSPCRIGLLLPLAGILLAGGDPAGAEETKPRRYDVMSLTDVEALGSVLARRVAVIEPELHAAKGPLAPDRQDGFGAVIGPHRLVTLSFVVAGTMRARVRGPKGALDAVVVSIDAEHRVAILETTQPLAQIGLEPAPLAPKKTIKEDQPIFALMATEGERSVLSGLILHDGQEPEYEGHPRISLKLTQGAPVFDNRARLVGYARAVAWDHDPYLIVPAEMITAARTATTSDRPPGAPPEQTRPWWAK